MTFLFLTIISILQVFGLLAFLRFKRKVMKSVVYNQQFHQPAYAVLGLTKEEYDECKNNIHAMHSNEFSLYQESQIQVEDEGNTEVDELSDSVEKYISDTKNDIEREQLSELLGTDNPQELEEVQRRISVNTDEFTNEEPMKVRINNDNYIDVEHSNDSEVSYITDAEMTESDIELEGLNSDLEEIQKNNISYFEEEPIKEEPKEKTFKMTSMGEGENLFNELQQMMGNTDETPDKEYLFSEQDQSICDSIAAESHADSIPLPDEQGYLEDAFDKNFDQESMINELNLLDGETTNSEQKLTDEQEEEKQELSRKLALLAEEGEGKKNMKEIVLTLEKLYKLEGKENDLKAIQEEYKEYFSGSDKNVRIYEEDIIRIGKESVEQDTFQIPEKYLWLATNKIEDNIYGKQRWVGKCIGINQKYIHFRDSSQRIWINVGEDNINNIELHDFLAVSVERTKDKVTAEYVQQLNTKNFA